jgi:hypothetical protein
VLTFLIENDLRKRNCWTLELDRSKIRVGKKIQLFGFSVGGLNFRLEFLTFSVFFSPVRAIYGDVRENDKLTGTLFDDTTPFLILERSKKEMTPKIGFRISTVRVQQSIGFFLNSVWSCSVLDNFEFYVHSKLETFSTSSSWFRRKGVVKIPPQC